MEAQSFVGAGGAGGNTGRGMDYKSTVCEFIKIMRATEWRDCGAWHKGGDVTKMRCAGARTSAPNDGNAARVTCGALRRNSCTRCGESIEEEGRNYGCTLYSIRSSRRCDSAQLMSAVDRVAAFADPQPCFADIIAEPPRIASQMHGDVSSPLDVAFAWKKFVNCNRHF